MQLPFDFKLLATEQKLLILAVAAEHIEAQRDLNTIEYRLFLELEELADGRPPWEEMKEHEEELALQNVAAYERNLKKRQEALRDIIRADLRPFLMHVLANWSQQYSDIYLKLLELTQENKQNF